MTGLVKRHALLSASGSGKWMACTKSAHAEIPFANTPSAYALEGTCAHFVLLEQRMRAYLGQPVRTMPADLAPYDTPDLREVVAEAESFLIGLIEAARKIDPNALVLLEERTDFSHVAPEAFGTVDFGLIYDGTLVIGDYKHGQGVRVSPWNNSQGRLYACGLLNIYECLFGIREVHIYIVQPRIGNIACEKISVKDLNYWADSVARPRAKMAWNNEGEFQPGAHCTDYFCGARFTCEARKQKALAFMRSDFSLKPPEFLSPEDKRFVLQIGPFVVKWIHENNAQLETAALEGEVIPGHKLVLGRSIRRYTNPDAIAKTLSEAGLPEELFMEKSLLGLTALEKSLGKQKFAELLSSFIEKAGGKPTLVPESDPRPAFTPAAQLVADFLKS
jgi:hypothetical protein